METIPTKQALQEALQLIDYLQSGKSAWSHEDTIRMERIRAASLAPTNDLSARQVRAAVRDCVKRIEWKRNGQGATRLAWILNEWMNKNRL